MLKETQDVFSEQHYTLHTTCRIAVHHYDYYDYIIFNMVSPASLCKAINFFRKSTDDADDVMLSAQVG